MTVITHWFAAFTGGVLVGCINGITGFTRNKHKLTVNMWERIQELENEVKELKGKGLLEGE